MKQILIKYLNSKEGGNDLVTEMLTNGLNEKAMVEFAQKKYPNDAFISKIKAVTDMGIFESIEVLKQDSTFYKDGLKARLNAIQSKVNENADIYHIQSYLNLLYSNKLSPIFESELHNMVGQLNEHKDFIALSSYYLALDSIEMANKRMENAKELLFEMLTENSEASKMKFLNYTENIQSKVIQEARQYLLNANSILESNAQDYTLENVYGIFEFLEDSKYVAHIDKHDVIVDMASGSVLEANEVEVSEAFKTLSKAIDAGYIIINEMVNIHANKVISINDENMNVYVGGKEISLLNNNVPYTLVAKYGIDESYMPLFSLVYEHLDMFTNFNMAYRIKHKLNESLSYTVFFGNKLNESSNDLFVIKNLNSYATKIPVKKMTISELRNDILESLNFDIKSNESIFESFFIAESINNKKKQEILDKIAKLEAELEKIEKFEDEEDIEDDSVEEVKKTIKKAISEYKNEYAAFESNKFNDDYIEVTIAGSKDTFYVKAIEYTKADKNDVLDVYDEKGNLKKVKKSDIKVEI